MILLDLEKEFGKLDSLEIDTNQLTQEKSNGFNEKINIIIYSDGKGEEINDE